MNHNVAHTVKESWIGGAFPDERLGNLEITEHTDSFYINELVAVAIATGEESVSSELLREKIRDFQLRLYESYRNFLLIYSETPLPEVIDKEARIMMGAYENQEKALNTILIYFEDEDRTHIAHGVNDLVRAFTILSQANAKFSRYNQAMGGKTCPQCEFINPTGEVYCKKCRHIFTMTTEEIQKEFNVLNAVNIENEITTGGLIFPRHIVTLFSKYPGFECSELSARDFVTEIDWLMGMLIRTKSKAERVLYRENAGPAREEVIQTGWSMVDGLTIINGAMNKLRLALLRFGEADIQDCWTELLYGTRKLVQGNPFYILIDRQIQQERP